MERSQVTLFLLCVGSPDVGIFILLKEMIVMFRDERFPLIGGFPIIGAKYLEMKCVEPSSNS
jgi:hypothetical protein